VVAPHFGHFSFEYLIGTSCRIASVSNPQLQQRPCKQRINRTFPVATQPGSSTFLFDDISETVGPTSIAVDLHFGQGMGENGGGDNRFVIVSFLPLLEQCLPSPLAQVVTPNA